MWTIFDSIGRAVANCNSQPNLEELAEHEQRAVFHADFIALDEAKLAGDSVSRKPMVSLTAAIVSEGTAVVSLACEDACISEIPLLIGDTFVTKSIGEFCLHAEPGLRIPIDFDRDHFRGDCLEVMF